MCPLNTAQHIIAVCNSSCRKVIFSLVSVSHSVHRVRCVCMVAGTCIVGVACVAGGFAWQGACVAWGHAWQGACEAGACVVGGMWGAYAWQGACEAGACVVGGMWGAYAW